MSHLFLDCDGVLADFDRLAEQIFGEPPRLAEDRLGTPLFWQVLRAHKDFYCRLPLMPEARFLFNSVAHLNPTILTGCPLDGWAEEQKRDWRTHHFPGVRMITCLSKDKAKYMQPGDVLIDDRTNHKKKWEEAGGLFIVYHNARQALHELWNWQPAAWEVPE